jgi:hypothetical protein
MAVRKPLTDAVISELASLAKIPNVHSTTLLNSFVRIDVETIWKVKALQANDFKRSPKLIAQAARELERVLGEASEGARQLVIWQLNLPPSTQPNAQLDDYQTAVAQLAAAAGRAARAFDVRGRKPWQKFRRYFIERLLDNTANRGGKLAINRRSEDGTLITAIYLFKDYLPEEFSKTWPSFSTVRRVYEQWLKKKKNRPTKENN